MRLRTAYRELFRRSGSSLSVPLPRMSAANREHLWDRRVLSTRKCRVAGDATAYTRPSDSGYTVTFYFCPHCGSTVYWEPRRKPEMVAVAVGAFADPAFPAPSQAVYAEHRHRWVPTVPAD